MIKDEKNLVFPRRMSIGGPVSGWGKRDGTGPNPDCPLKKKNFEESCKK